MVAHLGLEIGGVNVTATELLDDLNQVYRFDIPEAIGSGRFREQIAVTVAAGVSGKTDVNVAPATALYAGILGTWARYKLTAETASASLMVYSAQREFWEAFDPASTTQSRPTGILIEETGFTLRPIPSANGVVYLDTLKYRAALTQGGSILLDYEARVIEYVAAAYTANRLGDDDAARRLTALAGPFFDKLRGNERRSAHVPIANTRNF